MEVESERELIKRVTEARGYSYTSSVKRNVMGMEMQWNHRLFIRVCVVHLNKCNHSHRNRP